MPIIELKPANCRDPYHSNKLFVDRECSVEREENGACYCVDAPFTEPERIHDHLKVWGEEPEASPRYFAMEHRKP